jgi:hypothetical protein
VLALNEEVCDL